MGWIILYFSNPFGKLNAVLAAVNLALSLFFLYKLISGQGREQLNGMNNGINNILLICFFMIFFTFINPIYLIVRTQLSLASVGTGNPEVMIRAIVELLFPIFFTLAICSLFLIVWFLLRAYHRLKLEKAGLKNE